MLDRDIDPEFYRNERLLFFGLFLLIAAGIWLCRKNWKMAIVLSAIVFLGGVMFIPSIVPARGHAQRAVCINNLQAIQEAKTRWAAEHHKQKTDMPADSDLFGEELYLKRKPECPGGGNYSLGMVGEPPKCSLSARGHALGSKD
jgi:hypothetical protein